jgi:hypothetical protein
MIRRHLASGLCSLAFVGSVVAGAACSSSSSGGSDGGSGSGSGIDAGSGSGGGSGGSSGSSGSSGGSSSGGSSGSSSGGSDAPEGGPSDGSSGSSSDSGPIGLSPQTELGSITPIVDGGPNNLGFIILESLDIPNACTEQTPNLTNSSAFFFEIVTASESAIVPGTYNLGGNTQAGYVTYNATCQKAVEQATAGSITISTLDSSTIGGSYSLTFSQGLVSGSFSAMNCPSFGNGHSSSDAGCM